MVQQPTTPITTRPTDPAPIRSGPLGADRRSIAPDLARGVMLLLIVVSNTGFHLWGAEHGVTGWHPTDGGPVDRVAQALMIIGLDLRIYPMFALLVGYGLMRTFSRGTADGSPGSVRAARGVLVRRGLVLLGLGLAHATLLMAGDILGMYAVAGTVLGLIFLRRRDRTLWIAIAVAVGLLVLMTVLAGVAGPAPGAATSTPSVVYYASGQPDLLAAALTRIETWLGVTVVGALLGFASHAAILIGMLAARHSVLDRPGDHLPLLRRTTVLGLAIGFVGGTPVALGHLGWVAMPDWWLVENGPLFSLQSLTGLAAGVGYAAAFGLLAHHLRRPLPWPLRAVSAVGERSLSCYLAHSLLFAPLLSAWGLGLGARLSSATMILVAVAIWGVTVVGASVLDRHGRRGPAEALLRRVAYRR